MESAAGEEFVFENGIKVRKSLSRTEKRVIKRRQERAKYGLVANLSGCRYSIIRKVIEEAGFKLDDGDDPNSAYLIWSDTFISFERLLSLRPYQRVNHFPGMIEICRKDFFAKNYNRISKVEPVEYDFFPKTWVLPQEHNIFLTHAKRSPHSVYILKPANGAMGHGIQLFKHAEHITSNPISNSSSIVQEYITNPLLVDGYKCDLRVYVLVTSCSPLRIFVYNEGLVRLSTEKYMDVDEPNGESVFRHLTNYALNKHHSGYIKATDDSAGSKRSFLFLETYLREQLHADPQSIWRQIRNLIVKTMIIGVPFINHAYRLFHHGCGRSKNVSYSMDLELTRSMSSHSVLSTRSRAYAKKAKHMIPLPKKQPTNSDSTQFGIQSAAFEILGFDILLDRNLRPWLLEVNRSPSFGCDQELDLRVKSALLRDALHLINIRPSDKRRAEEAQKAHSIRRLLSGSNSQLSSPKMQMRESNTKPNNSKSKSGQMNMASKDLVNDWLKHPGELMQRIADLKERIRELHQESELECFENANCGNWRRVYPTNDSVLELRYSRLLKACFAEFNKGSSGDLKHVVQLSHASGQQENELRQQLDFFEKEALKLKKTKIVKSKQGNRKPSIHRPYDVNSNELWRIAYLENYSSVSESEESSSDSEGSSDFVENPVSTILRNRLNTRIRDGDLNIYTERAVSGIRTYPKDLFFSPINESLSGNYKRRTPLCPNVTSIRF